MDETSKPGAARPAAPLASPERQQKLAYVIGSLQDNLRILEYLDLTLAVALLDHAIEETKRHLNS